MENRNIIVHYHIFKNAGSSIDQLLISNFGDKWLSYDTNDTGGVISPDRLSRLIESNPDHQAFSSHQIVPPIPDVDGCIYPIVFIRDPIDRIRSAYLFEWQKQIGLDVPKGSFREYIESKFVNKRRNAIEDFQTIRLSNRNTDKISKIDLYSDEELYEKALEFILSLRFVGIVDRFDESCELLNMYLRPAFPHFKTRKVEANVLQDITLPVESKRQKVRDELGDELYEMVVERNKLDSRLYLDTCGHFDSLICNDTIKKAV